MKTTNKYDILDLKFCFAVWFTVDAKQKTAYGVLGKVNKMKTLFLMLCLVHFISQNKLYAEEFNFVTNAECPNRNRLHPANDTLCGVTNTTVLKCHASRVRCQGRGHWTSVCLFLPSENPRLERDFLENYRSYRCVVTSDFVHANCSSTVNSRLNFIAACNYTFYFCRSDTISCLENFARELEGKYNTSSNFSLIIARFPVRMADLRGQLLEIDKLPFSMVVHFLYFAWMSP